MAGRLFITDSWRALLERHQLASPQAVWNTTLGTVLKSAASTEVRRLELGEGGARRLLFLKKYWVSKPAQLWSGLFRGALFGRTKVRREFKNLDLIRQWGLHAPEPVAWGEIRRAGFVVGSFLLTESVPEPVMPLDRFIRDELAGLAPQEARARRRELIERLATATRRLHGNHFVHRDLYWRNIILGHAGRLDAFYLIDAHASQRWSGEGREPRAQDLAALDAPAPWFFRRTERLRFLLCYLGAKRLDPAGRALARRVLEIAKPIRERQLKRVQTLRA